MGFDDFMKEAGAAPLAVAPATETGGGFDAWLSDEPERAPLQIAVDAGSKKSPEQAARVLRLSRATGLPEDLVERNADQIEEETKKQGFDPIEFRKKSPIVADWMAQTPNNAALVQDDLPATQRLEEVADNHSAMSQMYHSLNSGLATLLGSAARSPALGVDAASSAWNLIAGTIATTIKDPLATDLDPTALPDWLTVKERAPEWLANNPIAKWADEQQKYHASQAPALNDSITKEALSGNYSKAGMALAVQFVANAPNQAALIVAALSGYGTLGLLGAGVTTASAKNQEAREQGLSLEQGTGNAIVHGVIESTFERLGTFGILKSWEKALTKEFGKEVSREVLKNTGKALFYSTAGEANEEFWTSVAQDFSDYVSGVNPNAMSGALQRALDAGIIGGVSGGGMTAPSAIMSAANQSRLVRQTQLAKDTYLAMGNSAEAMKARERLPEAQKSLVEKITQGSPIENIFIAPSALESYFQGSVKGDGGEVNLLLSTLNEMGLLDQYQTAKESGTDLKIPMSAWVDKMVAVGHYQGLANDVRFSPEALSVNELKEWRARQDKVDAQEADEKKAKAEDPELQEIERNVSEQIRAIGMSEDQAKAYGQVYAERYRKRGEVMGKSPLALFKSQGLVFKGPDSPGLQGGQEMNQRPTSDKFNKWFGSSVVVDANGEPQRVFHGTQAAFDKQTKSKGGLYGPGLYFTSSAEAAPEWAAMYSEDDSGEGINVRPAYLNIKNPVDMMATASDSFRKAAFEKTGKEDSLPENISHEQVLAYAGIKEGQIPEFLKSLGFDGIKVRFTESETHWVAFDEHQVKSEFDSFDQSAVPAPAFYSKMERTISEKMGNSATPEQIKGLLRETKEAERKAFGIDEFLEGKEKVSKEELLNHLRANALEVKEVVKTDPKVEKGRRRKAHEKFESALRSDGATEAEATALLEDLWRQIDRNDDDVSWLPEGVRAEANEVIAAHKEADTPPTKFSQYTLPGGENYREVLFTLPEKTKRAEPSPYEEAKKAFEERAREAGLTEEQVEYWVDQYAVGPRLEHVNSKAPPAIHEIGTALREARYKFNETERGTAKDDVFHSSHWDEPNVFAHARLKDRTGPNGEKILFIEEIQSDWDLSGRQQGFKGEGLPADHKVMSSKDYWESQGKPDQNTRNEWYVVDGENRIAGMGPTREVALSDFSRVSDKAVPDFPFRKNWHEYTLKRIIRMAAEGGYDQVAWTTGEQQAERYDLSKQINEVQYEKLSDLEGGTYSLGIANKDGDPVSLPKKLFTAAELDGVVGKEVAEKIRKGEGKKYRGHSHYTLEGLDLKIGGEGKKVLYDQIIPSFMNKMGKKFGAKVGETKVNSRASGKGAGLDVRDTSDGRWQIINAVGAVYHDEVGGYYEGYETREEAEEVMGTIETGMSAAPVHSLPITPELRKSALEEGFSLFQDGGDSPRGRIQFGTGVTIIQAFKTNDPSTIIHESGHLWLSEMAHDIRELQAKKPEDLTAAQKILIEDGNTILKWMGVESWDDVKVDQHEQFARGFEAYAREGVAPSEGLRKVFAKFRAWLTRLYKQVTQLNVKLTPEVRQVFDRMLATEEQIAAANQEMNAEPLFFEAEAWMPQAEGLRYAKDVQAAKDHARETLAAKINAEVNREHEAWWGERREKMRAGVAAEVNARPEYIALAEMTRGKQADGSPLPEGVLPMKINKKMLVEQFGEKILEGLPHVYVVKGGVHPDVAAERFGYNSAQELLTAVAMAKEKEALIDELTDQRMKDAYGDIMTDGTLSEEAMNAIHNDKRAYLMHQELKWLVSNEFATFKKLTKRIAKPLPSIDYYRQRAVDVIGRMAGKDINPSVYKRAEARAAKQAMELLLKGDFEGAFQAKERELQNHEYYRAAVEAREMEGKIFKYMQKFRKESKLQQLGKTDYLDQIFDILNRFEFARVPNRDIEMKQTLAEFVLSKEQRGESLGEEISVSDLLKDESYVANYREIPHSELLGIYDTVRQLEHIAIETEKMMADEKKMARDEARTQLIAAIKANMSGGSGPPPFTKHGLTRIEKAGKLVKGFDSELLKMEQLFVWMDGGDVSGPWHRFMWNPVSDAQAAEQDYTAKVTEKIALALKNIPKEVRKMMTQTVSIPGVNRRMVRSDVIGAVLNMGNTSSHSKLMRGMNWTQEQLDAMVDVLTKEEMDFIQSVWNTLEEIWPDIAKLQKELTGLEPEKLELKEVVTKHGTYKGGYYPAMYDANYSVQGGMQLSARVGNLEEGSVRATTPKGHTKKRVEGFSAPFDLDVDNLVGHIAGVVKDLTHRKWVMDANWLLSDRQIRAAIVEAMGTEYLDGLSAWRNRIANDRNYSSMAGLKTFKKLLKHLRMNFVMASMGFKATVGLSQIGGVPSAIETIGGKDLDGAKWFAMGFNRFVRNPIQVYKEVAEKSGEMRHRLDTKDRDLREKLLMLQGKTDIVSEIQRLGMMHIGIADSMVSVPTWYGAYMKALAQGKTEQEAIRLGDRAVRLSQGAGGAKDLAAVQAKSSDLMMFFTLFYTPFSALYARLRDIGHDFGGTKDVPATAMRLFLVWILAATIAQLAAGQGPDDDEEWHEWFMKNIALYPLLSIPILRDVAAGASSGYGYQMSPLAQTGKAAVIAAKSIYGLASGDEEWEDTAEKSATAASYLFGVPTRQFEITGGYMKDLLEGNESIEDLGDFFNFIYRRKDN